MSNKKQKKETIENPLSKIVNDVVEKGVKHVLTVGLHESGLLELGTSFSSFEEIHSILNRVLFEINKTHAEAIAQANKKEEEKN